MRRKILKYSIITIALLPIILIVGFVGNLHISKQLEYLEHKKNVYNYLQEEFGGQFELIRVEKEDFDFWTSRQDWFYFRDMEEDFIFSVTASNGSVDYTSYLECKFGKEVENEFYENLPRDITADFIFTAGAYDSNRADGHCDSLIDSALYIFNETIDYGEIYKLVQYIVDEFSPEWNDIDIHIQVHDDDNRNKIEKIISGAKDDKGIYSEAIMSCWVNRDNNKFDNLEEFTKYINENSTK